MINITQVEKGTQPFHPEPLLVICRTPSCFISIAPENLLTENSPWPGFPILRTLWLLALQLITWRGDSEVSGKEGCLWTIPPTSFQPANSKPRLSTLQGGFLLPTEEGRSLAPALHLPLWISSLFSRHFICSGILSQLKTSSVYISNKPDVPGSWSSPSFLGKKHTLPQPEPL